MRLNDLVTTSYEISKSKGWYDGPPATYGDRVALIGSEISEALEEFRKGKGAVDIYFVTGGGVVHEQRDELSHAQAGNKPEGIPVELGDAVIRCADAAGGYKLDLEEALWCHSVRHAAQEPITLQTLVTTPFPDMDELDCVSFGDYCATVMRVVSRAGVNNSLRPAARALALAETIWAVCRMAHRFQIDIEHAIEVKTAFNRTRPYRHGNKVL